MKALGVILLIFSFIAASTAAVAVLQNATHPDHPNMCFDENSKIALGRGETNTIPLACTELFCSESLSLTYTSCGLAVINDPKCKEIEPDLSKDYPECCIKYKCEVDGKVTYM
ncbi:uncharacterized protein LOC129724444 [Wyeomyia smithii]|uniref:uncharacterized protein LOC129724444 n=1 Tax=Wyeomyia smithii TaxID=174621 RepID=UPI0024681C25|nr:uncharacterized protein LOC129724444 [Wyeomyia smithii]